MSWIVVALVIVGLAAIVMLPVARAAARSRSPRDQPQQTSRRRLPPKGGSDRDPPPGSQRYRDEHDSQ
jgi:hypothetical protein